MSGRSSLAERRRKRREYLYQKNRQVYDERLQKRKEQVKNAVESGSKIPSDIAYGAAELGRLTKYDDKGPEAAAAISGEASNVDDEYRYLGVEDPKIVITTSRDPSGRLRLFAKELKLLFPNSQRINRGTCEMAEIVKICIDYNVTDLIVIYETRGNPDNLIISHLPHGPTAYFTLRNVVMRGDLPDIEKMPLEFPHLLFNNFETQLGERVRKILRALFPVPKKTSKKVVTFVNDSDCIVFRHHTTYEEDKKLCLKELGPRMHLFLYKIILGTICEEKAADTEYVYRPYLNTAHKKTVLSKRSLEATED